MRKLSSIVLPGKWSFTSYKKKLVYVQLYMDPDAIVHGWYLAKVHLFVLHARTSIVWYHRLNRT